MNALKDTRIPSDKIGSKIKKPIMAPSGSAIPDKKE